MANLPQKLSEHDFSESTTLEDIDRCLESLDPKQDMALINFWLDARLIVSKRRRARNKGKQSPSTTPVG